MRRLPADTIASATSGESSTARWNVRFCPPPEARANERTTRVRGSPRILAAVPPPTGRIRWILSTGHRVPESFCSKQLNPVTIGFRLGRSLEFPEQFQGLECFRIGIGKLGTDDNSDSRAE